MSIIYYSGGLAAPLRGTDISNALIELLSITRWEPMDYLILDMPPGISDATLDLMRLLKNLEFLLITTPSQLAFETVRKLASLITDLKIPIIGMVENMTMENSNLIRQQTEKLGLRFIGRIPYDPQIEDAIGNVEKLLKTVFANKVESISSQIQVRNQ
jgi:ATP-binding protein involved in chromosome partitioning